MTEASLVFGVIAGIIVVGFAGEFFFKKTGVPIFIFLILTGIVLGPVLKVFPREPLLPALTLFAEFTLLMVLFYGGMGLKFASLLAGGGRAFIQTILYVSLSILLIGELGVFILKWSLLSSLIFASMVGGETTAAVVIPLSRSMKLSESAMTFLTMESAMNSIFSIVLFFAFINVFASGTGNWVGVVSGISSQFSVGIVLGALLSLAWIFLLHRLQKQKFTYVLTLGFVLATYSLTSDFGGNGNLSVLIFGIILGNYRLINSLFKTQMSMDSLQKQLGDFHEEISFLMRTLFFVFLGLTFVVSPSSVISNLWMSLLILFVLLFARSIAACVSTLRSDFSRERRFIILTCAQGLTPATLAVIAVSLQVPLANTFLNIVTYVIILTNIVTAIGAFLNLRQQK